MGFLAGKKKRRVSLAVTTWLATCASPQYTCQDLSILPCATSSPTLTMIDSVFFLEHLASTSSLWQVRYGVF
jgi:uncharacterized lipoprotein YmbA